MRSLSWSRKTEWRWIIFSKTEIPLDEGKILLAGDYEKARTLCKEFCRRGFCVSLKKIDIVWTGGEAQGVEVYFFAYPLSVKKNIRLQGLALLDYLIEGLDQNTGTLIHGSEAITHRRA